MRRSVCMHVVLCGWGVVLDGEQGSAPSSWSNFQAGSTAPAHHEIFFFVPTLVSSAIKADSVLRQQWPRGMYSKVSLATGLDAGEAVLHRGRAQWGRRTCMYCTLHAGGGACHDHIGSTPRKTAKL